ncbi:MAG: TRAP transporter substrate-binding protein [Deltaproteobacteria bacterium]|nr:MAG: TRAP transporter substrate-binding protein [Deltaproteobacteria bacterium]
MKSRSSYKLLIFAAMISLIFGGFSVGQAVEKITFKFGHVLQTDHPYHKMALKFKEELEKRNKNCVVNIFPAKQLGNERDLVEGLQLGTVDISTITSALTAGFVPGFKVFSLPFLFEDADHLFRVMDSDIGKQLVKDMDKAGLIKLGFVYGGSRDLYARGPIRNLAELKGKKIRTMENKILVKTWNALGAIATPIPWGDVYLSLKQGVVDGGEGTGASYRSMKFFDSSPHYTRINYVFSWHNFMMSKNKWNKLPADVKKDVMAASEIAQAYERKLFVDEEKSLFKDLEQNYGVKIYQPKDLKQWRENIKSVYDENAASVGGMDYIRKIQGM